MIQFLNLGIGSLIGGFVVSNAPVSDPQEYPPSLLRFTSGTCEISGITMVNAMTSGMSGVPNALVFAPPNPGYQGPGGAVWIEGIGGVR